MVYASNGCSSGGADAAHSEAVYTQVEVDGGCGDYVEGVLFQGAERLCKCLDYETNYLSTGIGSWFNGDNAKGE